MGNTKIGSIKAGGILLSLRKMGNASSVAGMARFGINPAGTLGIPMPRMRSFAKEIGKDHNLAVELWKSGIHEARILASLLAEPAKLTSKEVGLIVNGFDSWDVCDQTCLNLLRKHPKAYTYAIRWSKSKTEFKKRAGFVLMAVLAVHDKAAKDEAFIGFLPLIRDGAKDDRNFVIKAVNWALRQIGKRNGRLYKEAIGSAREMLRSDHKSSRWAAKDALREFSDLKKYIKLRVKQKARLYKYAN